MATEPLQNEAPAQPAPEAAPEGQATSIDVQAILAKVDIHPRFKAIYDKAVLSGMRVMFDKRSHQMVTKYLDETDGVLSKKIADGVIAVFYMLWQQSNKTLPPQIVVPVVFTLTLRAFEFLQKSEEPEATKETLGEMIELAVGGVMQKFGGTPDQLEEVLGQLKARAGASPQPEAPNPGLLEEK